MNIRRTFLKPAKAILIILSALVCLGTTALWVRSFWVKDFLAITTMSGLAQIFPNAVHLSAESNEPGELLFKYCGYIPDPPPPGVLGDFIYLGTSSPSVSRRHFKDSPRRPDTLQRFDWEIASIGFHSHMSLQDGSIRNERIYMRAVFFPQWLVVLLTGAAPAWWLIKRPGRRRRRRLALGLCLSCGYDLRAST